MRAITALPKVGTVIRTLSLAISIAVGGILTPNSGAYAGSDDYKYEYKDGNCKYKYKENKHGYKEEYKCKGDTYGKPKYKHETKSGGCKYKYEESAKGYKEEYKCKKGRKPLANGRYWPKHRKKGPMASTSAPFDIDLGNCNRALIGGLLGAAAGGLAGSQIGGGKGQLIATAAGTFLGLVIGSEIGRRMDEVDRTCTGQIFEQAPDGRTIEWTNPDQGAQYQVTPSRTFNDGQNRQCREYQAIVVIDGRRQQGHGTACRQPDGSWQIKG